ncbi:MAG: HAMP domain-containing sensor histidine kinase [Bacteroidales bacterium]|nr:HAMP domain-containing sensor histidine kinase [Bacteroidales bacterium]
MKKLRNTTYNRFNIILVIQVLLIALTPLLVIWTYFKAELRLTPLGLALIWISQIIYLLYYLRRINRELARFLFAFEYEDSTLVYNSEPGDTSFEKIFKGFNNILASFGKLRIEKEKNYFFLQNLIEHVGIGLIAITSEDKVLISNRAFKNIFQLFHINSLGSLSKIKEDFPKLIGEMQSGDQELVKMELAGKLVHLAIRVTDFKLEGTDIRIVSFQDIKNEIEQGEMEAWQKLIRVLTHEILNSVSPVTLLSKSLIDKFEYDGEGKKPDDISGENVYDLLKGLHTINKRSKGLAKFVENYRNLTQLSTPNITDFSIESLFINIKTLFTEEITRLGVDFEITSPDGLKFTADERLLEQLIINLVRNSIHAIESTPNPEISIKAMEGMNVKIIQVKDNGVGISSELIESIFIPFFTTREKGSGIGLSLSRQIMRLHNGTISVESKENKGSTFTLRF